MKITEKKFTIGFFAVVAILALVRLLFPSVSANDIKDEVSANDVKEEKVSSADSVAVSTGRSHVSAEPVGVDSGAMKTVFIDADGKEVKSRIFSVPGFENTFPDQNDVQLLSAQKWGVKPVADSTEAAHSKKMLVYIGSNPYYYVDRLRDSSPYLVPRASVLLQDIGRNFFDSLQVKHIPLHKIIVTSVLRTKADVAKLQRKNPNAKQNSCHLYGTTFDVAYNRYKTVQAPGEHRREVRNDTLKWVLAEVMRDMRDQNRCFIKYEVKQGCWHITVK